VGAVTAALVAALEVTAGVLLPLAIVVAVALVV